MKIQEIPYQNGPMLKLKQTKIDCKDNKPITAEGKNRLFRWQTFKHANTAENKNCRYV